MKTSIIFGGNYENYMDYWEITATINPIPAILKRKVISIFSPKQQQLII